MSDPTLSEEVSRTRTVLAVESQRPLVWWFLISALGACSQDTVDLGRDSVEQRLALGTMCVDSPIVDGSIEVDEQAELKALAGCEEIRGDLRIGVFEGTDLAPLASLRMVTGLFWLGTNVAGVFDTFEAEAERARIVEAGWLSSLHGVEGLEFVGSLLLEKIAAPDLSAFESLRYVTDLEQGGGQINVSEARNLVDLTGLGNVVDLQALFLMNNPALESLRGLRVDDDVETMQISGNPRLADITALAPLQSIRSIFALSGTALRNLDGLASLFILDTALISRNPELENVDALAKLQGNNILEFTDNPKLSSIPRLPELAGYQKVVVARNPQLRSLTLSIFPPAPSYWAVGGTELIPVGEVWFEIADNAALETIVIEEAEAAAQLVGIVDNPNLRRIELGPLQHLTALAIQGNANLSEVALGSLETVNWLSVTGNPLLSTAELEALKTFESRFEGNAGED